MTWSRTLLPLAVSMLVLVGCDKKQVKPSGGVVPMAPEVPPGYDGYVLDEGGTDRGFVFADPQATLPAPEQWLYLSGAFPTESFVLEKTEFCFVAGVGPTTPIAGERGFIMSGAAVAGFYHPNAATDPGVNQKYVVTKAAKAAGLCDDVKNGTAAWKPVTSDEDYVGGSVHTEKGPVKGSPIWKLQPNETNTGDTLKFISRRGAKIAHWYVNGTGGHIKDESADIVATKVGSASGEYFEQLLSPAP